MLFFKAGETKYPRPFFRHPKWGRKDRGIIMAKKSKDEAKRCEEFREFFLECIMRQIHRMPLEDLREAYGAVSDITDRRKRVKDK